VVRKQVATDHVEGAVPKGKRQGIGHNRSDLATKVRPHAVQESEVQRDASSRQSLTNQSWNFSESRCYLQHRKVLLSRGSSDTLDQSLSGSDSAEPAVDAPKIT